MVVFLHHKIKIKDVIQFINWTHLIKYNMMVRFIIILSFCMTHLCLSAATWISSTGGSWQDPANWDCNCIPSGVSVLIPNQNSYFINITSSLPVTAIIITLEGKVTFGGNITAEALNTKAILNTAGDQYLDGDAHIHGNWELNYINVGGTMWGGIYGVSELTLTSGTLTLGGTLPSDGKIQVFPSGQFNNGGLFLFPDVGHIFIYADGTFRNYAESKIKMDGHNGTAININGTFINNGKLIVNDDTSAGAIGIRINSHTSKFISEGKCNINSVAAIENYGLLKLGGETIDTFIGSFYSFDSLYINSCKQVYMDGSCAISGFGVNKGTLKIADNTSPFLDINSFKNEGIFINYSNTLITLPPADNNGVLLQKKISQHYHDCPVTFAFIGAMTTINAGSNFYLPSYMNAGSISQAQNIIIPNSLSIGHNIFITDMFVIGCVMPPIGSPPTSPMLPVEIRFDLNIKSSTYYADGDFDGYGDPSVFITSCVPPFFGYVTDNTDCDDTDYNVNPGIIGDACNDKDYNCDGIIDISAPSPGIWYQDYDFDGFGNPAIFMTSCFQPIGYVADNTDCNDEEFVANTTQIEVSDGLDNDCDGMIDEEFTYTTTTFLGTVDTMWSNAANWDNGLPDLAKHAIIWSDCYCNINVEARSIYINTNINLRFHSSGFPLDVIVIGGNGFGIKNYGNLVVDNYYVTVNNIAGPGLNNLHNALFDNISSINIRNVTTGIINATDAVFNADSINIYIVRCTGNAIGNNGVFINNGFLAFSKINSHAIQNTLGTFINSVNGIIDVQNATRIPAWFIFNEAIFINQNIIRSPAYSVPANISSMGLWTGIGAETHNYKIMTFIGQRIAGPGMFVNHGPDGVIEAID